MRPSTGTPIFIAGLVHATKSGILSKTSLSAIDGAHDIRRGECNSEATKDLEQCMPINELECCGDAATNERHRSGWDLNADEQIQEILKERCEAHSYLLSSE